MAKEIDKRIPYYTRGAGAYNFGDYLTEYFVERMLVEPFVWASQYRLIGSAISDGVVDFDLNGLPDEARVAFWCCGARDEKGISPDRRARSDIWGVRGPLTRQLLKLPEDTPLGDPGYLVPLLHTPQKIEALSGKTASMVHVFAVDRSEALRQTVGADVALSASVSSFEELEQLFDQIASVDFLFTASLHGAIIASAFGTPFAFWDYGEVDIPFKWQDFCALLGIGCEFNQTLEQGRLWWEAQGRHQQLPALMPMLKACPFTVRPDVWQRAIAYDAAKGHAAPDQAIGFDRQDWIDLARQRNRERPDPDSAVPARHLAREELEVASKVLDQAVIEIDRRKKALELDFNRTPEVNFAQGTDGHALLSEGWTPANDIAPWSLPPFGEIILPAGSGWERAQSLSISAYLYVPKQADGTNSRKVWVWLNEVLAFEHSFHNTGDGDSMDVSLSMPIAAHLKMPRDLVIRICMEPVPVPSELGVSDEDRPIGLAPLWLKLA